MMMENEGPKNAAGFQTPNMPDRSASGLQFQSYQMALSARGAALGRGRRVAPEPNALFSTPLSGAQNGGGNARTTASFTAGPEED